jgi:hypothetical protein
LSTQFKLNNLPSSGQIRPLWSNFLVLSGYQVHGTFAHLHQHNNEEVADTLTNVAGLSQPKIWDPLHLTIPYKYLSALLFKPPDCCLGQWIMLATVILIYMIPLCCGAAYLTYLRLFSLPSTARPWKPNRLHHQRTALATIDLTLWGHTAVSFYTDSIPFIVNNSATCIITNKQSLLIKNLSQFRFESDGQYSWMILPTYKKSLYQKKKTRYST